MIGGRKRILERAGGRIQECASGVHAILSVAVFAFGSSNVILLSTAVAVTDSDGATTLHQTTLRNDHATPTHRRYRRLCCLSRHRAPRQSGISIGFDPGTTQAQAAALLFFQLGAILNSSE